MDMVDVRIERNKLIAILDSAKVGLSELGAEIDDIKEDLEKIKSDIEASEDSDAEEAEETEEDSDDSEEAEDDSDEPEETGEEQEAEPVNGSDVYTINDVERLSEPYGFNRKRIYYAMTHNKMPLPTKKGRRLTWPKAAIEDWLEFIKKEQANA